MLLVVLITNAVSRPYPNIREDRSVGNKDMKGYKLCGLEDGDVPTMKAFEDCFSGLEDWEFLDIPDQNVVEYQDLRTFVF